MANDPTVIPSDAEQYARLQSIEAVKPDVTTVQTGLSNLVKTVAGLPTNTTVNTAASAAQQQAVDQVMPQITAAKNIRSGVCAAKAADVNGTIVYVTVDGTVTGAAVFPDGYTLHLTSEWAGTTNPGFWPTFLPIDAKSFRIQAWRVGTVVNVVPVRTDATVHWLVRSKT